MCEVSLFILVRCLPNGAENLLSNFTSPFIVEGAQNVFLETVKRGEEDSFDSPVDYESESSLNTTVVLRLYEAFGGHAQAQLKISNHLPVVKAFVTNLLEDEQDELNITRTSLYDDGNSVVKLTFRGFEVKTVKLVLGTLPPPPTQKELVFHRG